MSVTEFFTMELTWLSKDGVDWHSAAIICPNGLTREAARPFDRVSFSPNTSRRYTQAALPGKRRKREKGRELQFIGDGGKSPAAKANAMNT